MSYMLTLACLSIRKALKKEDCYSENFPEGLKHQ